MYIIVIYLYIHMRKKGFTLIELLVVISIIS
ncbi:prepilin-type N-terminal cleavage/methylation domain-containing protein, partial [Campylobacter jejuni]|nr:prepilin-type N-terminal cleavage/methylation domain-containing protein [Campylobacter jejuni]